MATTILSISVDSRFAIALADEAAREGKSLPELVRAKIGAPAVRSGRPYVDAGTAVRKAIISVQEYDKVRGTPADIDHERRKAALGDVRFVEAKLLYVASCHFPYDRWKLTGTLFQDLQPPKPTTEEIVKHFEEIKFRTSLDKLTRDTLLENLVAKYPDVLPPTKAKRATRKK